jgi:hypothetical protein
MPSTARKRAIGRRRRLFRRALGAQPFAFAPAGAKRRFFVVCSTSIGFSSAAYSPTPTMIFRAIHGLLIAIGGLGNLTLRIRALDGATMPAERTSIFPDVVRAPLSSSLVSVSTK